MIAQLRRRHRWMTGAMGFVAFAGLMIGIAHRPPSAVMNTLPDALTQQMAVPKAAPNASGDNLWQGVKLKTTVYPRQVELSVLEPLYRPDPLLYWSEHIAESGAALPPGAILLGAVAGARRAPALQTPEC